MEIHEKEVLDLPVSRVWGAVNDPGVLKLCVPGCQEISVVDANNYTARAVIKVGFISAKFDHIQVKKVQAVENQQLVFEINGEDANKIGSFRLNMEVKLADVPGPTPKTAIEINADVDMKGKFATLGNRIVGWKSKGMMGEFVENLRRLPS
jgi:carbon monoxide dehydrogenase subunit G